MVDRTTLCGGHSGHPPLLHTTVNGQVGFQTFRGGSPFEIRVLGRCRLCSPSKFWDNSALDCSRFWTRRGKSAKGTPLNSLSRKQSCKAWRLELSVLGSRRKAELRRLAKYHEVAGNERNVAGKTSF